MKTVDQGIVLGKTDYSESSYVLRILTKEHGLQSFLFQGAKKKKGVTVLPMQPVEFTYYRRNDSEMGKITDWSTLFPISQLSINPMKSCICFFMAEVVSHLVHQGQPDKAFVEQLHHELAWLNASEELSAYPLWFLAECVRHAGITPDECDNPNAGYLDFKKGAFVSLEPDHPFYHHTKGIEACKMALEMDRSELLSLHLNKEERILAMDALIGYLSYQISGWRALKSLDVIRTVIS